MLRLTFLTTFCFVLLITLSFLLSPGLSQTAPPLLRITTTSEEIVNLNPSISGDGSQIAFESSGDLTGAGESPGFRAFRANVAGSSVTFARIATSRAVTPAISQDGSRIAFASAEDLIGRNLDRNSEIYLFDGSELKQVTETTPDDHTTRLGDGSFQPSISDDGRWIAFSSNRNLVGQNADQNFEIFLFDVEGARFTQITTSLSVVGATNAKLSGDASRIAYLSENEGEQEVLLRNLTTGATDRIATGSLSLTTGRAISDDGRRVVYAAVEAESQTQVYLYDSSTGRVHQITSLGARLTDVSLNPTISGDGKRIAFATRRSVIGQNSDNSVELYLYDVPTAAFTKLTSAPARATAEVIASLNDDGSMAVFNFPRVISDPDVNNDHANKSEIYLLSLAPRAAFGELTVLNGAALGNEPATLKPIAPDSIAVARGNALANDVKQATRLFDQSFPRSLTGTTVSVAGQLAQLLFVSPTQVNFVVPPETSTGPTEVIVTNSDGFSSIGSIQIAAVGPGLFTTTGDGRGEGIALNSDTFAAGPFDPSDGRLRLTLFATGVRNASNVSVSVGGQSLTSETVLRSPDLPGLDEIHIHIPPDLRGAGAVALVLTAAGVNSNQIGLTISGSPLREIMINEILIDPPDGLSGDANGDGVRDSSHDEFVELVNTTGRDLDISGFQLMTRSATAPTDSLRHRFALGTILPAGTAIVVFGGGNPDPADPRFKSAPVVKASAGGLSLLNSGGIVTLRDTTGVTINFVGYGGATGLRGDQNQSLTRAPDVDGPYALHQTATGSDGRLFSPGTRVDGSAFLSQPAISRITISPESAIVTAGEELSFAALAFDENSQELSGVLFKWISSDSSVATITNDGVVRGVAPGTSQITASARGVHSTPATLTVKAAPTPTPTPSPSPTGVPTPGPTPSPSPSPSPSPLPSPSPVPMPPVVISEFRTRGPGGASDEFIELYNNSDQPVVIGGWKIRGSSATGTITNRMTIATGVIIPARGHFLAVNSVGYTGVVSGDQPYTSGISNDGGIALTLPDDSIVDQVGMAPASAFREGMHLAPLVSDANQSYERKPGGPNGSTQDTNDNFDDFLLTTPSDPQNLNSAPTPGQTPGPSPTPSVSPSPSASPSPSPTAGAAVVISQVYGGGGNSGAPLRNDFIEIFNRGTTAVDLADWSIQYSSATGLSWSVTPLAAFSLQPGQYYLIQEGSGGNNGATLPAGDSVGSIAMAAGAGKVALVNATTALSGTCPSSETIVDLVGYGSAASCFQGTGPTASPGSTTAVKRNASGCSDTQSNVADFIVGPPTPRNSAVGLTPCSAQAHFTSSGYSYELFRGISFVSGIVFLVG